MGRLIDADALKESFKTNTFMGNKFGVVFDTYIDNAPTIEERKTGRWIPCSERLPELNQICIVTDETRKCAYEYGLHYETYDDENGWTYLGHRIVAWMPLPEPYKEVEHETD